MPEPQILPEVRLKPAFEEAAKYFRMVLAKERDLDSEYDDLARCWQQYSARTQADQLPSATYTMVHDPSRRERRWQLVVQQRVTTYPGKCGLEAWPDNHG